MPSRDQTHPTHKNPLAGTLHRQASVPPARTPAPAGPDIASMLQRLTAQPHLLQPVDVQRLQRTIGNQAVAQHLAQSTGTPPRQPVQMKLTVSAAGDRYEQEADRLAETVLSMPEPAYAHPRVSGFHPAAQSGATGMQAKPLAASITPLLQRAPEEEEELQMKALQRAPEEEEELQMKALQRAPEEEEELQTKALQRQPEEEELQTKALQRQPEEEELQTKALQRQPEEEELQMKALQRAPEEEEELQMKALQRAPEEEEELQMKALQRAPEEEEEIQGKTQRPHAPALHLPAARLQAFDPGADFERRLSATRGGGAALPAETRQFMEGRFGADFSAVRLHTGGEAALLNREVQAQAFTRGHDIYLGEGRADLGSSAGKRLLAHELTHTIQQGAAPAVQRSSLVGQVSRHTPQTIQRAFWPATTITKTTHLRKFEIDADSGAVAVKTGYRGRKGRNVPVGSKLVIDDQQKYNQRVTSGVFKKTTVTVPWVRSLDVKPADWDPANSPNSPEMGYIREAKVQKDHYPYDAEVFIEYHGSKTFPIYWNAGIGEFVKVAESPANPNLWLVKPKKDPGQPYQKYNAATHAMDTSELTYPEKFHVKANGYEFKGMAPDGNWLIGQVGGKKYRYDPTANTLTEATYTEAENIVTMEHGQKGALEKNLARDPNLAPEKLTTTPITYTTTLGGAKTVNVKGNSADRYYAKQLAAVRAALLKLQAKNIVLQDGLTIYISSSENISEEAFHYGPGYIVMKPKMFANPEVEKTEAQSGIKGGTPKAGGLLGVAHQLIPQDLEPDQIADSIGANVVVHEIGHVLHKLTDPGKFYKLQSSQLNKIGGTLAARLNEAAKKVSHYASSTASPEAKALEFVAEVFTGLVSGKKYSQEVIDVYKAVGGRAVWTNEADVVEG